MSKPKTAAARTASTRRNRQHGQERVRRLVALVLEVADELICDGAGPDRAECREAFPADATKWCPVCHCRDFADHDARVRQERVLAERAAAPRTSIDDEMLDDEVAP